MLQKIIKAGNSIAVTIPSKFVKSVGVKVGDNVQVSLHPQTGKVIYTFKGTMQLSMEEGFKDKSK